MGSRRVNLMWMMATVPVEHIDLLEDAYDSPRVIAITGPSFDVRTMTAKYTYPVVTHRRGPVIKTGKGKTQRW